MSTSLKYKCIVLRNILFKYNTNIITEEDTKAELIFPLISEFQLTPAEIKREKYVNNGLDRMDIQLRYGKEKVIIEAKKLHHTLTTKDQLQLIKYMKAEESRLGILTNGDFYEFYIYKNNTLELIQEISIKFGLYEDDLNFLSKFIKSNFDINYFLNYNV